MGPACPSAQRSNNPVGKDVHPDPVTLACSRLWKCKGAEPGLPVYHVPNLSGLSNLKYFPIVSLFSSALLGCGRDSSARDKSTAGAHVASAAPLLYLVDNVGCWGAV